MVDRNTEKKIGLNFARLLVEVEVDTTLPDDVFFKNEKGILIEQKIQYDWKPVICKYCKKYGDAETKCRKKNSSVKEPRKVEINKNANVEPMKVRVAQADQSDEIRKEQLKGTAGDSMSAKTKRLQNSEQNKQTGWTTPTSISRSPKRQENQMQVTLDPFNVLCEAAQVEWHIAVQYNMGEALNCPLWKWIIYFAGTLGV